MKLGTASNQNLRSPSQQGLSGSLRRRIKLRACFTMLLCTVCFGCEKAQQHSQSQLAVGVVVGDSMAPRFLGRHLRHQCSVCNNQHVSSVAALGRSSARTSVNVVCPNCGKHGNIDEALDVRPAENVSVDMAENPKRWDVVAFRRAGEAEAGIKRVIGLPGEKIVFRDGNAFAIDSAGSASMLVKSLEQQRELRIPVFDGSLQLLEDRWPKIELSNLNDDSKSEIQWRQFAPQRCYDYRPGQPWKAAIEDSYGFNQTVDRKLNVTGEVFLQFDVDPKIGEEVWIRFPAGMQCGRLRIRFEKGISISLFENESTQMRDAVNCEQFGGKKIKTQRKCRIEFSNFDGQLLLAMDGKVLLQRRWSTADRSRSIRSGGMVAVGHTMGLVPVDRIRLWRDVFWFTKLSEAQQLDRQRTGDRGYFLVGDNVPVSVDSRHWDPPFVPGKNILGRVNKLTCQ